MEIDIFIIIHYASQYLHWDIMNKLPKHKEYKQCLQKEHLTTNRRKKLAVATILNVQSATSDNEMD